MSKNEKKGLQAMAVCMIAALLALLTFFSYEEAHRVRFADRRVGNAITKSSGTGKKPEDFRVEDFAKVEELVLGLPAYFETLSDIERCMNLTHLEIGERGSLGWIPEEEDILGEEGIAQLERELADILESCGQLEDLIIYNGCGTCNLSSLGFVEKGESLEKLRLYDIGELDYSPVFSCRSLWSLVLDRCRVTDSDIKKIDRLENLHWLSLSGTDITEAGNIGELKNLENLFLDGTDITEAGGLVNLENLKVLDITNTPLAGNAEELKFLREALPDTKIVTDGEWW